MQQFSDWLIVGACTLGMGITTGSFAGGINVGLVGSTTGAIIGASITTKLQDDRQRKIVIELDRLKELVDKQQNLTQLNQQLTILKPKVETLKQEEAELAKVSGQFRAKQAELKEIEQRLSTTKQQQQELENRINIIKQQAPDLFHLEQLQQKIEQFKLEKSGLEGQINALVSQVQSLESQRINLYNIESQLASKKVDLDSFDKRIQELQTQSQQLEKSASELELLRAIYDGLFSQKQTFEEKVNQLRPDIDRLEAEKQRILQAIQESQNEYHKIEEFRQRLHNLKMEIRDKELELRELEKEIQHLYDIKSDVEKNNSQLTKEREVLQEDIKNLRPEIEKLEIEKQSILQGIQESQKEHQRIEKLIEESRDLIVNIRNKESELRELEREIQHLHDIKSNLEKNNSELTKEREILEAEIKKLTGDIDTIENSANLALQSLNEKIWYHLPNPQLNLEEKDFITGFIDNIQSQGLTFHERVINAFHTSLKVQDISALVILAGISGTGKSELPQRYANYIGAQLLTLAVQPRWDSPQDLQGFYNYVEKKFKPTDLMRGLYQYNNDSLMQDRIVIVLLDEMNLARVEYYFSEFLSKLETRRNHATYLEIDIGSLRINERERRLQIPNAFLFVGTMNEDETTQSLSDKVLDRANVLTFGKPQNLKLRQERQIINHSNQLVGYLPYSNFQKWIKTPDPNSDIVERVKEYLNQTNQIMEEIGHPFAHRIYQAITQYVINYPGVENLNSPAFKFAIADQFGQKLLPKLRGVMVDEAREKLDRLERIISDINDQPLTRAFQKSRTGRYGQFTWTGLVYQDEQV